MGTTLVVADATIVARTEARALTCLDLRPLANTSSTSPSTTVPTNIPKYPGEMNPGLWLEDYRLVC